MTTKSKRELSSQIKRILKEYKFYRSGGSWNESTLHIGIQPNDKFRPDFSNEDASNRFRAIIKQIKAIKKVKTTKSRDWCSGWYVMAGIEIIL